MSRHTLNYDKLINSRPLKAAAMQIAHTAPERNTVTQLKPAKWYWFECPQMRPWNPTGDPQHNLTGQRFGRVVVQGQLDRPAKDVATWVYRCDCGTYGCGRAKAIKKGDAMCALCEDRVKVRHRAFITANGRYPNDDEYQRMRY